MDTIGLLPGASNQMLEDGLPVPFEATSQSIMDSLPESATQFQEESRSKCRQDWIKKEDKGDWGLWHESEHYFCFCLIMYFDSPVHETEEPGRGMKESCRVEMSEMGFEARKSHT